MFCLWISVHVRIYILHCIKVMLSLFLSLCFSCILSWIVCIEFVMAVNIHQVFGVPLEPVTCRDNNWLIYFILFLFIFVFCFIFILLDLEDPIETQAQFFENQDCFSSSFHLFFFRFVFFYSFLFILMLLVWRTHKKESRGPRGFLNSDPRNPQHRD